MATSDLWRGALSTSSPTVAYRGLESLGAAHPLTKQVVRHDSALLLFFTYVDDNRGGEEERKEGEDAADKLLDGQQSEKLHNRSRSAMPSPHTS